MGRTRLDLHDKFREILVSVNPAYKTEHLYFRKPSSKMKYPCIIYNDDGERPLYADNKKYLKRTHYVVTVVDENPDSIIKDKIDELPYASYDRSYEADQLNHFVFSLYF